MLALKIPSNYIIRTVYALSVLSSAPDKNYKATPKVQNMWSQIGKKEYLKNFTDMLEERLDSLPEKKIQIAKECAGGLSIESVSNTNLDAGKILECV